MSFRAGHFVANLDIVPGPWRFMISATAKDGSILAASFHQTFGDEGVSVRNLRTIGLAAIIAVTALVASACGGGGTPRASATIDTVAPRPSSTAKITILSPKTGSVVHGSTVDLRITLEGARIVKQTSTTLRPDEGHVHVLLDGQLISMNYGLTDTIPDLTPGQHLLQVEFVATDHAPFDPRVIAVTSFEVQA